MPITRLIRLAATVLLIAACAVSATSGDVTDRSWIFTSANNNLGWTGTWCPSWSSWGVAAGYWWGATLDSDPWIIGPDWLNVPGSPKHYLSVRMRMRLSSSPGDRFGKSDAQVYFTTYADPAWAEDKRVSFLAYGNGEWKTYNVRLGGHARWTGTIRQVRLDPNGKPGSRIEVAWIKLMQDTTGPTFSAENMWTYPDGGATCDTTPTVSLRDVFEDVSGIDRVEFYKRPGASVSDGDWVLDSVDYDGTDGYQCTYQPLADGVYDLWAKAWDKSGNAAHWSQSDEMAIDDVTVDSGLAARIDVDASVVGDDVPRGIFSNNLVWSQWSNKYSPSTNSLTANLESSIAEIGMPVCRYPGGCYADTFYWKRSIGPVASRPEQFLNGCNTNLYNAGSAKFGLDEYLRWCEARGMQPMFTCRFRWPGSTGAPGLDGPDPYAEALADAVDVVEYCNSPNDGSNPNGGTDWAAQRAANGHPEPYNVRLFEIGNEPWGPDPWGSPGNVGLDGPSEYSVAFINFVQGMTAVDPTIKVSATTHLQGQLDFDPVNPEWTYSVYSQVGPFINYAQGHPYLPYSAWQKDLVKLYDETMATPKGFDDLLSNQRTTIRRAVPEKAGQMKLRLTEWGVNYGWSYDTSQGRVNMYHVRTLKAAVALADALRVFVENRDIVESAEWWHLYSGTWACIGSDDVTPNPVYHVFRIFNKHFGDKLVPSSVVGSPTFDYVQSPGSVLKSHYGLAYLTAIASKSADGKSLYLVVVNKDRTNARSAQVNIAGFLPQGASQVEVETWELNGPDVDDYTNIQNVMITATNATYGSSFSYSFPAHSVTSFKVAQAPVATSVGNAKTLADGVRVSVPGRAITARFGPDTLYVEDDDRASGIMVSPGGPTAAEGNLATVVGRLATNNHGERLIDAESVTHDSGQVSLRPWGMTQNSLVSGPDSTGLLVTVWGWTSGSESDSFFVNDGSGLLGFTGSPGVKVYSSKSLGNGRFVRVTGIKSLEASGGAPPQPVIRTRRESDIVALF